MMFKSKHSGWTWDLKRTPFGGGGGFISAITDPISSALGTDGGGGGLLGGLAQVDKAVNQIPGGWITVGGLAAGGAALAYAPEVMALAASEGITPEAAAIATGTAPIDVATGATVPLDTLAADVGASTASPDVFAGLSANAPVDTSLSQAAASSMGGNVADIGLGTNAPLQGPTYGELGVTGVPEGGMGPTYAEMGNTGLNTQQAVSAADSAAQLQQAKDALSTANQVRQGVSAANTLSKLLSSGAGSSLTGAAQNLATGQSGVGMAIPALLRGNQNPFTFTQSQPIQDTMQAKLASLLKQG
jgi:hypothetical protein